MRLWVTREPAWAGILGESQSIFFSFKRHSQTDFPLVRFLQCGGHNQYIWCFTNHMKTRSFMGTIKLEWSWSYVAPKLAIVWGPHFVEWRDLDYFHVMFINLGWETTMAMLSMKTSTRAIWINNGDMKVQVRAYSWDTSPMYMMLKWFIAWTRCNQSTRGSSYPVNQWRAHKS